MLPAMNVEDRVELVGAMRDGMPSEAFAAVWALAYSVLPADECAQLGARLGVS
jgi:hypothetical protein